MTFYSSARLAASNASLRRSSTSRGRSGRAPGRRGASSLLELICQRGRRRSDSQRNHPAASEADRTLIATSSCTALTSASTVPPRARAAPTPASASRTCPTWCGAFGSTLTAPTFARDGPVATRQTEPDLGVHAPQSRPVVACRACAEERDRHAAHHDHCRVCAEVCRRCEQTCSDLSPRWAR